MGVETLFDDAANLMNPNDCSGGGGGCDDDDDDDDDEQNRSKKSDRVKLEELFSSSISKLEKGPLLLVSPLLPNGSCPPTQLTNISIMILTKYSRSWKRFACCFLTHLRVYLHSHLRV
jgi:hypothetical protein